MEKTSKNIGSYQEAKAYLMGKGMTEDEAINMLPEVENLKEGDMVIYSEQCRPCTTNGLKGTQCRSCVEVASFSICGPWGACEATFPHERVG